MTIPSDAPRVTESTVVMWYDGTNGQALYDAGAYGQWLVDENGKLVENPDEPSGGDPPVDVYWGVAGAYSGYISEDDAVRRWGTAPDKITHF